MKPIEELRAGFDDYLTVSQGVTMSVMPTFDNYVACEMANEYYAKMRTADPHCPICKGLGYLPTNGPLGLAASCSCVNNRTHG